jgi:Type III secretion basal body protein I, YscI, HrpB, PscI
MNSTVSNDLSFSQVQQNESAQTNEKDYNSLSTEDNQADAQEFQEMMASDTLSTGSLGDRMINQFTHITNQMQQFKTKANDAIMTATNNPDPKNILQMMHRVNDYSEQMIIGSRLVTKLSSAADQLTKLQ